MKVYNQLIPISGRADVKNLISSLRAGKHAMVPLPPMIPGVDVPTEVEVLSMNDEMNEWVVELQVCKIPVAQLRFKEEGTLFRIEVVTVYEVKA